MNEVGTEAWAFGGSVAVSADNVADCRGAGH
jgi:hypothetical protein